MGCGGRGSVGRASMFAGRFSVSDRQRVDERRLNASARTSAGRTGRSKGLVKEAAYGKTVWSWRPLVGGKGISANLGRRASREGETVSTVIASEAKQSIVTSCTERWIASLRSQ